MEIDLKSPYFRGTDPEHLFFMEIDLKFQGFMVAIMNCQIFYGIRPLIFISWKQSLNFQIFNKYKSQISRFYGISRIFTEMDLKGGRAICVSTNQKTCTVSSDY